jgi:phosphatidylglycerophosphatase A
LANFNDLYQINSTATLNFLKTILKYHKIIASVFGIGFLSKGGGTVAAFFACLSLVLLQLLVKNNNQIYQIVVLDLTIFVTVLGKISAKAMEPIWGEDSSKIVIDEVAGMLITLCFVPFTITNIAIGFVLFRLLDIYKPLYIRRFEKYPNGWGVMLDDVAAGIWANMILQLIIYLVQKNSQ